MTQSDHERRRAHRHAIQAESVLQSGPTAHSATTVNVSASGALLDHGRPADVQPGQDVACELHLPPDADPNLPRWSLGQVVRVDETASAIRFDAGVFCPESEL